MAELGVAFVDVRGDYRKFEKEAPGKFGGVGKKAAAAFGAAFAAVQAGKFLGDTVSAASDLEEAMNVTGLVFGDARGEIDAFVKSAAKGLGQSETAAREATAQFGGLLTNLGFAQDSTVGWSQDLTTLSSDLASAFNTDPADAAQALGAALRGESEPIKRFNVFLSDAALKAKALELGLYSGSGALDANAKAQAALALITEQTAQVQGDFANTSDGLANKQRILTAQVENAKAKIGNAFLPVLAKTAAFISDTVIPVFEKWAPKVKEVVDVIVKAVTEFYTGTVKPIFDKVRDVFVSNEDTVDGWRASIVVVVARLREIFESYRDALVAIFNFIAKTVSFIWEHFGANITAFIGERIEAIKEIFRAGFNIVQGIFETFAGLFSGDWGRMWDGIKAVVDGVWDGIIGIVRSGANFVISILNALVTAFSKLDFSFTVPDFPGLPRRGQKVTIGFPDLPPIPFLADGGNILSGGAAIVGEAGPELLQLPAGAQVSPLAGGGAQPIHIDVDGETIARVVVDRFGLGGGRAAVRTA